MRYLIFFLLIFWLVLSEAGESSEMPFTCPGWLVQKESLPPCPKEGSLLSANYPVGAIFMSVRDESTEGLNYTSDVIEKILLASHDKPPIIILSKEEGRSWAGSEQLVRSIADGNVKEKLRATLFFSRRLPPIRWQQDYIQSTFDSKTGQPLLHFVKDYVYQVPHSGIDEPLTECQMTMGRPLKSKSKYKSGISGGNIEALPEGICLLGDSDFKSQSAWSYYIKQFCSSKDKQIKVPTSWLQVGHTDEVISIVANTTGQAPCNFSILVASPHTALERIRHESDQLFFSFVETSGKISDDKMVDRLRKLSGMDKICEDALHLKKSKSRQDFLDRRAGKSVSINAWPTLMSPIPYAAAKEKESSPPLKDAEECRTLTNGDIYRLFGEDLERKKFVELVGEKMADLKKEISQKIKLHLPTCEPDFLDVPVLFTGRPVKKKGQSFELAQGMSYSFLPNAVNSFSINNTVISSDPGNSAFRSYMESELKKRGVAAVFVDDFDHSYRQGGGLHCTVNLVNLCKPRN